MKRLKGQHLRTYQFMQETVETSADFFRARKIVKKTKDLNMKLKDFTPVLVTNRAVESRDIFGRLRSGLLSWTVEQRPMLTVLRREEDTVVHSWPWDFCNGAAQFHRRRSHVAGGEGDP